MQNQNLNLELIHHPPQRFERLARQRIPWLHGKRFLEATHSLAIHFFAEVGAAQVVMRKMTRLVTPCLYCLLQPRNGLIKLAKFNQVRSDIVVRIAEVRIEFDRTLALRDGIQQLALEVIRPAEKSMRFGRWMEV